MITFSLEQFEAAQQHTPQIARWTIGNTIYVVEKEQDMEFITNKLQEVKQE